MNLRKGMREMWYLRAERGFSPSSETLLFPDGIHSFENGTYRKSGK